MDDERDREVDPGAATPTTPGPATPWWARSSGEAWDAPSYADTSYADTTEIPSGPDPRQPPPPGPPGPYPGPPPSGVPFGGPAPEPASPWRLPADSDVIDTLGRRDTQQRRPRTGLLVTLALVIALVAGVTGGAAGFLLADRQDQATVDGADLGTAPARSVQRPAGTIPSVAEGVLPSVVQIKVETSSGRGTGSGFVIDDEGLILTNNHVVAGRSADVRVTFIDGTTRKARVVGTSGSYDLAVLKVPARNLKPLPLGNSDDVVVGDPVIAIGSPLGLSGTVTSGIVSALNRPVTAGERGGDDSAYINAIQTDAAINPGNSGGPLVDLDGRVVGINSAIATVGGSATGEGGNIGVGFAIPINQARRTAEQLIETGEAQFPIIGASLDGTYEGSGARIAERAAPDGTPPLVSGGPADKAGLEPGDVIVAIDGSPVEDSSQLIVAIRSKSPGDTVTLDVRRGESETKIRVELAASKD